VIANYHCLSVTAYEADNLTVYFFASHTHNLNVNIGLENILRDSFFSTASAEISTSIKSIHNTTNTTIFFSFLCSFMFSRLHQDGLLFLCIWGRVQGNSVNGLRIFSSGTNMTGARVLECNSDRRSIKIYTCSPKVFSV
jgi:hypothetical protein